MALVEHSVEVTIITVAGMVVISTLVVGMEVERVITEEEVAVVVTLGIGFDVGGDDCRVAWLLTSVPNDR